MLGFLLWSSHGSNFRYFLKRYIGALGPQIVCPDVLCDLEQPRRKRSEEHTSELQSQSNLVCRLLLEKKKNHLYVYSLRGRTHHDHYVCRARSYLILEPFHRPLVVLLAASALLARQSNTSM